MLNPIENQGLRRCVGVFHTSPEDSLAVEANELPMSLRREKLALQYATKVAANTDNPAYNCIFNPNYIDLFNRKEKTIPTFGIRIKESLEALHFNPNTICKFQYPETPPWTLTSIAVDLSISNSKKNLTNPSIFRSKVNEIKENYRQYKAIYTDGSCKDEKSAAAAVTGDHFYSERLPNRASIFTCELHGFYLAMDHVETSTYSKFVIYSNCHHL